MTIGKLLEAVARYDISAITIIRRAYDYANYLHEGQVRQSGEPYISHPLNVAYILSEMKADRDTICAALLHDVLEDNPDKVSKEEIARLFNEDIAILVDGVTKISRLNFNSKNDQNMANMRKIITSLMVDVRIILIKLADRLHNMRTLQYKSEVKQKENATETLKVFVPLAYYLGAYRIKSELEDLSIQYLEPDKYLESKEIMEEIALNSKDCILEMKGNVQAILDDRSIPNELKVRTKNIHGVYKQLISGGKIEDMHDLIAFKIMVNEIDDCYLLLRPIHAIYRPVNGRFKDYICNPKTNMYQSLHTTVFGPDERLVQMQLRTFKMDRVASFGVAADWDINRDNAKVIMQDKLKTRSQFYDSLLEINKAFGNNHDFVSHANEELFTDKVYVYTTKGDIIELPKGSTIIDFAYKVHTDIGNTMVSAIVNEKDVPLDYVLQNKDRVRVVTNSKLCEGPKEEWANMAKTTGAKRKIREYKQNRIFK